MEQKNRSKTFKWRAFTTFYIVISFLVISTSGVILYIAPPGRVAYWSEWTLFGVTKEKWQAVHTIFTFLFVAAAALHVYFNWKVLISYLKMKLNERVRRGRELALASGLVIIVIAATLLNLSPISNVMTLGDNLSNGWVAPQDEPPVPHAELLTLEQFADKAGVALPKMMEQITVNGLIADSTTMLVKHLAFKYNLTPQQLYAKMRGGEQLKPVTIAEGGGYGRKTVAQVAGQLSVPVPEALSRLRQNAVSAEAASVIRDLASEHNLSPIDLVKFIGGERRQ